MLKNKNRLIILLNYFIVFIIFIYVNNKYYDINNILTIVLGNNITSKSLFIERTIYLYHLFINIYISLIYFDNKLNYNMEFINLRKKIKNYFLEVYLNINVKNILINIISVIIISILFIKFKGIMSFNIFHKLLIFILFNITISNDNGDSTPPICNASLRSLDKIEFAIRDSNSKEHKFYIYYTFLDNKKSKVSKIN